MMPAAARILCYDCDAFFVQCAYVAWPDRLRGVDLLLVGGHPQGRGVVASCSYGTREFGVRSGMPMAAALRLCPGAIAAPVPRMVVRRKSREVRAVVRRFGEAFESASVDEGYLTVPPAAGSLESAAREIQRTVMEETGITISLGGGTRKFVAKMATSHAKPAGVYVVPPGAEEAFVAEHELGDIPGVGPAFLNTLHRHSVYTIGDALDIELRMLIRWLGPARAEFLYNRVRAIDGRRIGEDDGGRKSISSETTFERDVADFETLRETLSELVADVGRSLRKHGLRVRTVSIKLRDADFNDRQKSTTLRTSVQTDQAIYRTALDLMSELRRGRSTPIRLVGVGLSNLAGPGTAEQLSFPEIIPPLE